MASPRPPPAPADTEPPPPPPAAPPTHVIAITAGARAATPPQTGAAYVRNSSFLSKDIEAQKARGKRPPSPPRRASDSRPPVRSPPVKSPPTASPPVTSPPVRSPPVASPPAEELPPPPAALSPPRRPTPPRNDVVSPPTSGRQTDHGPKNGDGSIAEQARESPARGEKSSAVTSVGNGEISAVNDVERAKPEESNGVGDKIKKFEKAAEDAGATAPRSRPGSIRRVKENSQDAASPATPFKDNVHFDLPAPPPTVLERQQSLTRNSVASRWPHDDPPNEKPRPEPQKIIKPEFKPIPSPIDVTIRSPSLGAKIENRFPSHGTAFRNVATPDPPRPVLKLEEEPNAQNNFKTCKVKKEKYSVSKGSSYFTRGTEEIWLVKKKDIEEIEERVLDSFRRAGGNLCMRSESMRPSSDGGQGPTLSHTMGRNKRQMYARSESLDPQWAGSRAHTLKRQTSVACTCGHDKKIRAKSAGAEPTRTRSRSHGDDNNQGHVLDKYETLV